MFRLLLLGLAAAVSLTGCATDSASNDPNNVSTIPWNRPEKWEGGGVLGGMMNTQ